MLALASAGTAVMDTLQFRYSSSIFAALPNCEQWINPALSWRNKWKAGDPKCGEAFIMSSSVLVSFTDAWHLAKTFTIACIIMATLAPFSYFVSLSPVRWVAVFFGLYLLYGLVFEMLFGLALRK